MVVTTLTVSPETAEQVRSLKKSLQCKDMNETIETLLAGYKNANGKGNRKGKGSSLHEKSWGDLLALEFLNMVFDSIISQGHRRLDSKTWDRMKIPQRIVGALNSLVLGFCYPNYRLLFERVSKSEYILPDLYSEILRSLFQREPTLGIVLYAGFQALLKDGYSTPDAVMDKLETMLNVDKLKQEELTEVMSAVLSFLPEDLQKAMKQSTGKDVSEAKGNLEKIVEKISDGDSRGETKTNERAESTSGNLGGQGISDSSESNLLDEETITDDDAVEEPEEEE